MGVTPPKVATNRARYRSKVLRLAMLNFVENFFEFLRREFLVRSAGAILAMVTI